MCTHPFSCVFVLGNEFAVESHQDQINSSLQTRRKKTNELTNIRSEIHAHKLRKEKKKTGHEKSLLVFSLVASLETWNFIDNDKVTRAASHFVLWVPLFFFFLPYIVWSCHHNGEHSIDGCLSDACVQPCSLRMLMNFKVIRRFVYMGASRAERDTRSSQQHDKGVAFIPVSQFQIKQNNLNALPAYPAVWII